MSTRRRHKTRVVSSDEDDKNTIDQLDPVAVNTNEVTPRSSQRLRKKSERRSFVLPSRGEIWDAIPSDPWNKSLSLISPRKTVNNFTKVYNSYNYDNYEDSSADDSDGFITDSSGNNSSSDEQQNQKFKSNRIKNFKRRIKSYSSSDDDDISISNGCRAKEENNLCDNEKPDTDMDKESVGGQDLGPSIDCNVECLANDYNGQSGSDSDGVSPVKRRRNTSLLELESDSSDCFDPCEGQGSVDQPASSQRDISDMVSNTRATSTADDIATASVAGENNLNSSDHSSVNVEIFFPETSSSDCFTDSDSEDSNCEIRNRSAKFKRKKEKLFQKFKDIQKLKKNSKSS